MSKKCKGCAYAEKRIYLKKGNEGVDYVCRSPSRFFECPVGKQLAEQYKIRKEIKNESGRS